MTVTDDTVIERLRAALDEVAASPSTPMPGDAEVVPWVDRSRHGVSRRWIGVAAVSMLLAGSAAWLLASRDAGSPAAEPAPEASPPTNQPIGDPPAYTLIASDLAPGKPTEALVDVDPTDVSAWQVVDPADSTSIGLLAMKVIVDRGEPLGGESPATELDPPSGRAWLVGGALDDRPSPAAAVWWSRGDGTVWYFEQAGLTTRRLVELSLAATTGSGVPFVVADPSASYLGFGRSSSRTTSRAFGNDVGTVDVRMEGMADGINALIGATDLRLVEVAGHDGFARTDDTGAVIVVWNAGNGWWGRLTIPPELADRTDAIVAAVVDTSAATPAEPVAPPSTTTYRTVARIIESPGSPPQAAFTVLDSLPPQGGDVPLAGFDWSMIGDEQTIGGTTWSDTPYELVGTWDGSVFALTEAPAASTAYGGASPVDDGSGACTDEAMVRLESDTAGIDTRSLGVVATAFFADRGVCRRWVEATFDTPALRAAYEPFADVVFSFLFQPVG